MTKFYLQSDGEHSFIDQTLHNHCRNDGAREAENWIAAKKAFGFELTALQQRMLDGRARLPEILGNS